MESITYKEWCSFEEDVVESFVVLEELFSGDERKVDLQILLEDIVGEAG